MAINKSLMQKYKKQRAESIHRSIMKQASRVKPTITYSLMRGDKKIATGSMEQLVKEMRPNDMLV